MGSSDGGDAGTFEIAVAELVRMFEPVEEAVQAGPAGIIAFLDETGVSELLIDEELEKVVDTIESDIADPMVELSELLGGDFQLEPADVRTIVATVADFDPENPDPTALIDGVRKIVEPIDSIIGGVQSLSSLEFEAENLDDAGERVMNYLLVRYLQDHREHAHRILRLTNVIELPADADPWDHGTVEPGNVEAIFDDPGAAAASAIGWGEADLRADLTIEYLQKLFGLLGVAARIESPITREQSELIEGAIANDAKDSDFEASLGDQLAVPVVRVPGLGVFGFRIVPVPDTTDHHPGVSLVPYGPFDQFGAEFTQQLGDDWTFTAGLGGQLEAYGMVAQPTKPDGEQTDVEFRPLDAAGGSNPLDEAHATAGLTYDGMTAAGEYRPLIGTADGTNLALGSVGGEATLDYEDGDATVAVEFPSEGRIVIKPSGGFLEAVLPEEVTADFETLVGWSTAEGIYFEGGTGLEVPLPMHTQIGPITLKEIYLGLGLDPETGAITAEASAAATVSLGPITGTVERMGVDAELAFPDDQDGNLGPVDLQLGFKPPSGVGLSVDAGPVSGTGMLRFYPEENRYSGAAQLKISTLQITAVGLITTELPDGSDGFSMQVVVAGEFPPIQLGFGFTLTGVGGLLGINRRFRKNPLRNVVRRGSLDSILFPERETVENNPQRVLSDIRSIFPPKRDSYLFGPMVQLGYGTPAVLKSSLGVVLEIPSFRVVVVGRFELVLPNHEAEAPPGTPDSAPYPPIVLNLDVVGIIDIPGKSISIDATLYDSRMLQWTVEGDMALRANWGDGSRFILSVGGFNPRYTPPKDAPGLQSLDRVKVSLDVPGGQPVVEFTGYFAVTSNTFQVGAAVHAELTVGDLKIWGDLGFDALFQFKPFKFVFDFIARFMIRAPAFEAGFELDGTITGPNPFTIDGTVRLSIGPVEVSTKVDIEIGDGGGGEELPPAEILPEVRDALNHSKNWDAQRPTDASSLVSIRGQRTDGDDGGDAGPVLVHPLGTLTVRQTVVPLGYTIEKFGEATPKSYDRFRIESVTVEGVSDAERRPVDGEFAPAQYRRMSDAEKLDSPDFVQEVAGTAVGSGATMVGGDDEDGNATTARFVYEEHLYDEAQGRRGESLADLAPAEAGFAHTDHVAGAVAAGRKGPSRQDRGRFSVGGGDADATADGGGGDGAFAVGAETFRVVDSEHFEPVTVGIDSDDDDGTDTGPVVEPRDAGRFDGRPDPLGEGGTLGGLREATARDARREFARSAGRDEADLAVVPEYLLEGQS